MKKATLWLCVLILLIGCAVSVKEQERSLKGPVDTTVPPIKLSEYIIGPGDVLQVKVWRHPDFSSTVKVQPDGMVSFPLIGDLMVTNMGLIEFRDLLAQKFDKYVVDPQVSVLVAASLSNKFYVLGEVHRPGMFVLDEPKTISEAIIFAGGFTYNAKKTDVVLMRKGTDGAMKPVQFDVDAILEGEEPENDVYLQRGDIVYVPLSNVSLVDRFFYHLNTALSGILGVQQVVINYPGLENVITGDYKDTTNNQTTIIVPFSQP